MEKLQHEIKTSFQFTSSCVIFGKRKVAPKKFCFAFFGTLKPGADIKTSPAVIWVEDDSPKRRLTAAGCSFETYFSDFDVVKIQEIMRRSLSALPLCAAFCRSIPQNPCKNTLKCVLKPWRVETFEGEWIIFGRHAKNLKQHETDQMASAQPQHHNVAIETSYWWTATLHKLCKTCSYIYWKHRNLAVITG